MSRFDGLLAHTDVLQEHMGVAGRGLDPRVTEQPLRALEVAGRAHVAGAGGVARVVAAEARGDARLAHVPAPVRLEPTVGDRPALLLDPPSPAALGRVGEDEGRVMAHALV